MASLVFLLVQAFLELHAFRLIERFSPIRYTGIGIINLVLGAICIFAVTFWNPFESDPLSVVGLDPRIWALMVSEAVCAMLILWAYEKNKNSYLAINSGTFASIGMVPILAIAAAAVFQFDGKIDAHTPMSIILVISAILMAISAANLRMSGIGGAEHKTSIAMATVFLSMNFVISVFMQQIAGPLTTLAFVLIGNGIVSVSFGILVRKEHIISIASSAPDMTKCTAVMIACYGFGSIAIVVLPIHLIVIARRTSQLLAAYVMDCIHQKTIVKLPPFRAALIFTMILLAGISFGMEMLYHLS